MHEIAINSLVLLLEGTNTGYTVQLPVQGLDGPTMRLNAYDKPGEDGSTLSSIFAGSRTLQLNGTMQGATAKEYEALRSALALACAPQRDSLGNPVPTVITFTTLGGYSYQVLAYPQKPLFDYTYATYGDFQINFVATDPLIYSTSPVTSPLIHRPGNGGFILPVLLPFVSQGATGGAGIVSNTGTANTDPLLTLVGQLTDPYILNSTTGQFIQLDYTIQDGDVVVIDMANKTIMLNDSTPLLSMMTLDSSWWSIAPGDNSILLNTNSSSDDGSLMVEFLPAFWGV